MNGNGQTLICRSSFASQAGGFVSAASTRLRSVELVGTRREAPAVLATSAHISSGAVAGIGR